MSERGRWAGNIVATVCFIVSILVYGAGPARAADRLLVFAPSSLTEVIGTLADTYERKTGADVVVSVAASSTLARQIEAGAPADIFISADEQWMDYLQQRGRIVGESRRSIVGNALVLVAPVGDARPVDLSVPGSLAIRLAGGRLALADPDHVPAGRYAKAALQSAGQWNSVKGRVVGADNVRVALTLVARREAALGVVYQSDARLTEAVAIVARFPAGSHPTILYPGTLVTGASPRAAEFLEAVTSPEAAKLFAQSGFVPVRDGHVAAQ